MAASGREAWSEQHLPETLYGKEADKGQHAEALEGFSWTTEKELGASRVEITIVALLSP